MSWLDRVLRRKNRGKPSNTPRRSEDRGARPSAAQRDPLRAALHTAVVDGDRDKVDRLLTVCEGRPDAPNIMEVALAASKGTRWHAVTRDLEKAKQAIDERHATLLHGQRLLADVPTKEGRKYLDPCELLGPLGRGAMGIVYKAHHANLGAEVAVKCLDPVQGPLDLESIERFRREAQAAAAIQSPNVVRVLDVLNRFGVHYIIMEYVRGETARERVLRIGALPFDQALHITREAARGLGVAHRAGIVHRDVKPDNILISTAGDVKVSDLGLANPHLVSLTREARAAIDQGQQMILTNALMGTPLYMAPEQWMRPEAVCFATDVWALGASLYFLVAGDDPTHTGRPCGLAGSFPEVRQARDVPADLSRVIEKATLENPHERYRTGSDLADEIDRMLSGLQVKL